MFLNRSCFCKKKGEIKQVASWKLKGPFVVSSLNELTSLLLALYHRESALRRLIFGVGTWIHCLFIKSWWRNSILPDGLLFNVPRVSLKPDPRLRARQISPDRQRECVCRYTDEKLRAGIIGLCNRRISLLAASISGRQFRRLCFHVSFSFSHFARVIKIQSSRPERHPRSPNHFSPSFFFRPAYTISPQDNRYLNSEKKFFSPTVITNAKKMV